MPRSDRISIVLLAQFILGGSVLGAAVVAQETLPVFKLDAVALASGTEVAGDADLYVDRHRFRYLFANADNRVAFVNAPEKYEIQLGGACARMGALNTGGRPELFAVHDHKLYLFASEACRSGFLAAPEKLLATADPGFQVSEQEQARADQLLDLAEAAMGGKENLNRLTTLRQVFDRQVTYDDKSYRVIDGLAIEFPRQRIRVLQQWDGDTYGRYSVGEQGWFIRGGALVPMHASQLREHLQLVNRHPLVILKSRSRPDFVARLVDADTDAERDIHLVQVHFSGCTSTLGIEAATHRIVTVAYHGRGPSMALGDVQDSYADFETHNGIQLARQQSVSFAGKPVDSKTQRFTSLEVSLSLPADTFPRLP